MTVETTTPQRSRSAVLDGIRGVAIALVVASHIWVISPANDVNAEIWKVLLSSGDFAVTIFFVVGGFLAVRAMLREVDDTGTLRFGVTFVRRWIRISAHVYPLVIAVLALTAVDEGMNVYSQQDTRESAWRIVTYTWNGYVRTNPLEARPDLGHLWYVCTDIWVIGLLAVLVYLLGKRRIVLLAALIGVLLVVLIYRDHVYATEGEFAALVRLQTRADGLLWGAMAAVALPWARRYSAYGSMVGGVAVAALVPLMWAVDDSADYFGLPGALLGLTMAIFVIATSLEEPSGLVSTVLGWRPLVWLGNYSLVLYIWHYPIFWYLSRNAEDWSWGVRVAVGLAATLAIGVVSQALIEQPLRRWMAGPAWRPFDQGLVPGLLSYLRRPLGRE